MLALIPRANVACRALMARWLVAFCRASKWYIREDEPLEKELVPWLEPHELQQLVGRNCLQLDTAGLCNKQCSGSMVQHVVNCNAQ
jgi:hypothetical protein